MDLLTQAARDVLVERQRQITEEGFTPERDDRLTLSDLAEAAACYAWAADADVESFPPGEPPAAMWPWEHALWKPGDQRRMLVKAGALILAEIERLDRAASRA